MVYSGRTEGQCSVTNPIGVQDLTGNALGQSFTASCSGILTTITVEFGAGSAISNAIVYLRDGNDAAGTILGSLTGITLTPGTTGVFDFSSQNISLTNAAQYTFVIDDNGSLTTFSVVGDIGDTYGEGSFWFEGVELTTFEMGFSTQIVVPDTTTPSAQSILLQGSPTANATSITKTITFDEPANNISTDDFELTTTGTAMGTIASVSAASGTTVDVTINSISGAGTLRLDLLGTSNITDNFGNGNGTNGTVAAFTTGNIHTVDVVQPRIASITRQTPTTSPTNADTLTWDIVFNEAVNNVDISDFMLTGTTASINTITNPSGNTYRVTASGGDLPNANATVTLGFNPSQNITDLTGNALVNTSPIGTNNNTFVLDNTATISAVSIDQNPVNTTNASSISYTFTDAETGATFNYSFSSDGGAGTVNGSGTVTSSGQTVSGIDLTGLADGTITLSVTLTDVVGNISGAVTDTTTKKTTLPTVTISSVESSPTGVNPIPVTITFSEDVSGFTIGDLIATNSTLDNFSGSGANYSVDITPLTNGAITLNINANVAIDNYGNGNAAATQFSVTYDNSLTVLDHTLTHALQIYPVPVSNTVTIASETNLGLQGVKLFDLNGRLVLSKRINAHVRVNTINMASVHAGVYIMQILSKTGFTNTRIIKQ